MGKAYLAYFSDYVLAAGAGAGGGYPVPVAGAQVSCYSVGAFAAGDRDHRCDGALYLPDAAARRLPPADRLHAAGQQRRGDLALPRAGGRGGVGEDGAVGGAWGLPGRDAGPAGCRAGRDDPLPGGRHDGRQQRQGDGGERLGGGVGGGPGGSVPAGHGTARRPQRLCGGRGRADPWLERGYTATR